MIYHRSPIQVWIDYIISVLVGIVTTVATVLVNDYFYNENREAWKKTFFVLGVLVFIVLLLMTVLLEFGEEVWIEEIQCLLRLVG